ncbi:39S ribosomal protein L40, mitochondrial [Oryx dammah]|uniref:39S ribosomal protein L40, mitochondrial n=1 Tax=Oryx dammah TaxID=59534 RepID=UPI001A9BBC20|nr:39S ribosomal protein L40, mitochondrial [Oryx dammah]
MALPAAPQGGAHALAPQQGQTLRKAAGVCAMPNARSVSSCAADLSSAPQLKTAFRGQAQGQTAVSDLTKVQKVESKAQEFRGGRAVSALCFRAEPLRKKKKVDPKKDQAAKERLKKRIRRLEKATQELIPIEDFITPVEFLNQARQRPPVELPFEESERRALLLKKWSLYKQREHELERAAIASLLEAQREALQELELTAPELHAEATKRDPSLFPFERQGPDYTPPIANYQPPEGRYQDITKVYTQVEFKR